ncbi:MAG: sigma 54-interacting transcriptional regulator [Peptococcaceae bacterium]|jgi:transcriptional regulator with PAS, ATPase and Fis domain|nr:sigma 54-interacting transcriptional regulator [Peptococcaceae bacterium]
MSAYDHEAMIRRREAFIAGEDRHSDAGLNPEVLSSWMRARERGVNPRRMTFPLPEITPAETAEHMVREAIWQLRWQKNEDIIQKVCDILDKTNAVEFNMDLNFTIWLQRGNREVLQALKNKNLGIGSNLSESLVGTTAAVLTARKQMPQWVVGAEHYIEGLRDYVSLATLLLDENNDVLGYKLILTPMKDFNPFLLQMFMQMLDYYISLCNSTVNLHWMNSELTLTQELFTLSFEQRDRGMILIDEAGFILKISRWLSDKLELKQPDVRGKYLTDVFPEMKEMLSCLREAAAIPVQEMHLAKASGAILPYFIEGQPIRTAGQVKGLVITVFEPRSMHKFVNKIYSHSAYFTFEDIIGTCPRFAAVKQEAAEAAEYTCNVFITGESGTGKELFAQAIHNAGNRRRGPFISINCAAMPRELIGSELFGYVEGAFTGARKGGAPGKFELADKGTIFLDEIGEMPLDMQSVLLRVLEDKQIVRLGGGNPILVDARIIAATNKNLWQAVLANHFRLDLYYRLNVFPLHLLPLRERQEDIPLLIESFLQQFKIAFGKNISGFTPETLVLLKNYAWPGNCRELRNVVERACAIAKTDILTMNELPKEITESAIVPDVQVSSREAYDQKIFAEFKYKLNERKQILDLLHKYKGNKTLVAKELGVTRVTLYKKLKLHDLSEFG